MRLEWTLPSLLDLKDAGDFIYQESPRSARQVAERVQEAVEYLISYPNMGRHGRVSGTRELVVSGTPFIVVYRIHEIKIQILRVLHHAREWPAS